MSVSPSFATTPVVGSATIIAADNAYTNPSSNVYSLLTGATNGTRVDRIVVSSCGNGSAPSAANVLRFWIKISSVNYLYISYGMTGLNGAGTFPTLVAAGFHVEIPTNNLVLPSGYILGVTIGTHAGANDDFAVLAYGADL